LLLHGSSLLGCDSIGMASSTNKISVDLAKMALDDTTMEQRKKLAE
jgi:hypothetical protein